ncbi:hypothetical protein LX36DRAFT_256135 [Colletotrichum falcatum]|nr:hypothetical protein LX36DRAFT_256135 [Colletotrichum falcatum]
MRAYILILSAMALQVYAVDICQTATGSERGDLIEGGITEFSGGVDSSADGKELSYTRPTDPTDSDAGALTLTNERSQPVIFCINADGSECFSLDSLASCYTQIQEPSVYGFSIYSAGS